jgi:hypothetical protein
MRPLLGWKRTIGLLVAWSVPMLVLALLAGQIVQLAAAQQLGRSAVPMSSGPLRAATIAFAAVLAFVWIGVPVLLMSLRLETDRTPEERPREPRGEVVFLSSWRSRTGDAPVEASLLGS